MYNMQNFIVYLLIWFKRKHFQTQNFLWVAKYDLKCMGYVGQFAHRGCAILIDAQVSGQLPGNSIIVSKEVK